MPGWCAPACVSTLWAGVERTGYTVKTVVIGASSGLGRCIATGLAHRGDQIAVLARRLDLLTQAAQEAGPGTLAISCDVTDEESCTRAIDQAASGLGEIDALVYTPGVGPLVRLADTDGGTWRHVLNTNVVGAAIATRAAISRLTEARGVAVYLSSVSASLTPPWPGLGAYAVSKAALDKLIEAWRSEHPQVGFTRLVVGDCAGGEGEATTQFADAWDRDLAAELIPLWSQRNYLSGSLLDVEHLVNVMYAVTHCGSGTTLPTVTVVPRPSGS